MFHRLVPYRPAPGNVPLHSDMPPATPAWFAEAMAKPFTIHEAISDGCRIEYMQWGSTDKPFLLFVHGNGGHANWWDFIAPSFADHYCVAAIHLAGMGNSGYRHEYDFDSYARDLVAVASAAGYEKNITIVGHSMGGVITMRAAENYPEKIKRIVVVDSPLVFRKSDSPAEAHKPPPPARFEFKGKKYYPDFETALGRYHLVPAQPCKNSYLLDHVARHSIRQYKEGWSWKFDDGIYFRFRRTERPPFDIQRIASPMAYIHGGKSSLVPERVVPDIQAMLKSKGPVICIPEAHHHIMLDEPEELTRVLESLLKH